MKPIDVIIIAVIVLVVGGAAAYIIKAKKSGKKCIGCPFSESCGAKKCGCCCDGSLQKSEESADVESHPAEKNEIPEKNENF